MEASARVLTDGIGGFVEAEIIIDLWWVFPLYTFDLHFCLLPRTESGSRHCLVGWILRQLFRSSGSVGLA